ncbi:MAG: hypothetical protein V1743_07600 [Nanoarchaeota archaeon]
MASLNWCKGKKKGIRLVMPNAPLAEEYMHLAQETLELCPLIKGRSELWLSTMLYYAEYFAAYAVLCKIGIRSEIHDCTIEVCRLLETQNIFPIGTTVQLEEDKKLRIDNQYYLKSRPVRFDYNSLLEFISTIKSRMDRLTSDEAEAIRKIIERE